EGGDVVGVWRDVGRAGDHQGAAAGGAEHGVDRGAHVAGADADVAGTGERDAGGDGQDTGGRCGGGAAGVAGDAGDGGGGDGGAERDIAGDGRAGRAGGRGRAQDKAAARSKRGGRVLHDGAVVGLDGADEAAVVGRGEGQRAAAAVADGA